LAHHVSSTPAPRAPAPFETTERTHDAGIVPHPRNEAVPPDGASVRGRRARTTAYASAERMFAVDARVEPAAADSSPPTVFVTIGRVEVRATSKEPQTPASRSRNDSLSLEAYLRRGARSDR